MAHRGGIIHHFFRSAEAGFRVLIPWHRKMDSGETRNYGSSSFKASFRSVESSFASLDLDFAQDRLNQ